MENREKAKEIVESHPMYKELQQHTIEFGFDSALKMATWKDEQMRMRLENMLDFAIESCNSYIEKRPENKLMLKYYLGQVGLLDKILETDSRDRIHMAFATMD